MNNQTFEESKRQIEQKDNITFKEFKGWLNGLIVGKRGSLPDLHDWKLIKMMIDRVKEEKDMLEELAVHIENVEIPQEAKDLNYLMETEEQLKFEGKGWDLPEELPIYTFKNPYDVYTLKYTIEQMIDYDN